jgi:acyl-CoA thioesterase
MTPTSGAADAFGRDTTVEALAPGRYAARIDRSWWIVAGPNGGYVAAIVLRAVVDAAGGPDRPPRSATFHYLRPPAEGPLEVHVTVERTGRTVTNASARLVQDDRLLVVALVALGGDRDATVSFDDEPGLPRRPDGATVAMPEDIEFVDVDPERDVPTRSHYDLRWALGDLPFNPGEPARAHTGGWMRLPRTPVVDEVALVAMADAWLPPAFSRMAVPLAVPTVDLTVHFRGRPADDSGWVFGEFWSPVARDGYLVEHGRLLDRTGRLLAESRQTAVVA